MLHDIYFQYQIGNAESEKAIFAVPDFIGFACRQLGKLVPKQTINDMYLLHRICNYCSHITKPVFRV